MTYAYYPPNVLPAGFAVARGANDILITEDGREYIDLLSGSSTVFLGHANPAIARGIKAQLDVLWNTGAVPTVQGRAVWQTVESFLPPSHRLAVLYSTGMEAVEFALRVARQVTRRKGVVGFAGCMHGKSMATAHLGWSNPLVTLPEFHRLPYLPERTEEAVLEDVRRALATETISAVVLEPLLGSRGGYMPSPGWAQQLAGLCAERGTLLILDEIFTGFYRTGPLFLHQELGINPDILLVGKAMGNGFPVSGVVLDRRLPVEGSMLPGSTYAGNPLAASAVIATLAEMRTMDMPGKVRDIERTIRGALGGLTERGMGLRGKGALWVIDLPPAQSMARVMARILREGVVVSTTANFIRILPAATIVPANLARACDVIYRACKESGSALE